MVGAPEGGYGERDVAVAVAVTFVWVWDGRSHLVRGGAAEVPGPRRHAANRTRHRPARVPLLNTAEAMLAVVLVVTIVLDGLPTASAIRPRSRWPLSSRNWWSVGTHPSFERSARRRGGATRDGATLPTSRSRSVKVVALLVAGVTLLADVA